MRVMLIIVIALALGCCDVKVSNVTVWRAPTGLLADALHQWHGGEPHD